MGMTTFGPVATGLSLCFSDFTRPPLWMGVEPVYYIVLCPAHLCVGCTDKMPCSHLLRRQNRSDQLDPSIRQSTMFLPRNVTFVNNKCWNFKVGKYWCTRFKKTISSPISVLKHLDVFRNDTVVINPAFGFPADPLNQLFTIHRINTFKLGIL